MLKKAMKTAHIPNTIELLIDRIRSKQEEIHHWLESYEGANELPLYSSVDIRNAGFKNVCEHGLKDSEALMRVAINKRVPGCRDILIIAEEHTRNTWYLENVRILEQIIRDAGFEAKIATFLTVQPDFCTN